MFRKRTRPDKLIAKTAYEDTDEHISLQDESLARKRAKQEASGNFHSTSAQGKQSEDFVKQEIKALKFEANAQLTGKGIDKTVTRSLDVDGEEDGFDRAKKNIELSKQVAEGKLKTNVYRGEAGYANYVKLTEDDLRAQRIRGTLGPLKKSTNIRSTVRVDYQKYLCKDYNENGYCGRGDTCIYLHDRYDYKAGWEVDAECEAEEKREQLRLQGHRVDDEPDYEIRSDEEDDRCPMCERDVENPVATPCGHVFCEACALKHNAKSGKCFLCNKETGGIINSVKGKGGKGKKAAEGTESERIFKEFDKERKKDKEKVYRPVSGWVIP